MTTPVTRPNRTGVPGYSQTMPCVEESAPAARRIVRAALETWSLRSLAEDSELIVTEMVANSAQHSRCRYLRLVVSRTAVHRVRIAVSDRSRKAPLLRDVSYETESGRGLFLIEAYADCWGTDHRSWGKIVWAELATKEAA